MDEYKRDCELKERDEEREQERDDEREQQRIVAVGLVECEGCGQYGEPDTMARCASCGKRMHKTCMDPMPEWLCDDYVCGPRCEVAELEQYLNPKVRLDQEDIDRVSKLLEELQEALLPDGIATALLHLHALRETLHEAGMPVAANTATEVIALIRRLAHPGRPARKAV